MADLNAMLSAVAGAAGESLYVEDVFQTWLYTGNGGSSLTINNGIDLSGEGGLIWFKTRSAASGHALFDTARTRAYVLDTSSTSSQSGPISASNDLVSFDSTGFTLGSSFYTNINNPTPLVSWTFRKAEKFFDVVTYTGNGGASQTISHNLGSTPGCIVVKRTDSTTNWEVYHRSLGATKFIWLNSTSGEQTSSARWNDTSPTSTQFTVGSSDNVNASGGTYVAYLFAHDAGGFGDDGNQNVISCGSFTTDGSGNATVTLGYEPQLMLVKKSSGTGDWVFLDTMRGWVNSGAPGISADARLYPNLINAESLDDWGHPTATGMYIYGQAISQTYIYIAIRRGPMKTPTSGTSVFTPFTYSGDNTNNKIQTGFGFPPDLVINRVRNDTFDTWQVDRLRGGGQGLRSYSTAIESAITTSISVLGQDGVTLGSTASSGSNASGFDYIHWTFRRAPGFFDVVCYTGTGVTDRVVNHNLGVAPELIITKCRSNAEQWGVGTSFTSTSYKWLYLALTNAALDLNYSAKSRINSQPTSTQYTIATDGEINQSTYTYVAYLFATVAGVSKVGSYTGTGTTLQVNCGFTGGARFVLIKRTDSTGDWYVWDSARGIVSGNDPYLLLNSTAAEVTNTDYVDTYSSGFEISSTAPAAINANGGTFIFLAIA